MKEKPEPWDLIKKMYYKSFFLLAFLKETCSYLLGNFKLRNINIQGGRKDKAKTPKIIIPSPILAKIVSKIRYLAWARVSAGAVGSSCCLIRKTPSCS